MSQNPTAQSNYISEKPTALIIGDGLIPGYLLRTLEDNGCLVKIITSPNGIQNIQANSISYLFQFTQWEAITNVIEHTLQPEGKAIFVDTAGNTYKNIPKNVRIIKCGILEQWEPQILVDHMLAHMFATHENLISDLRSIEQDNEDVSLMSSMKKEEPSDTPLSTIEVKNTPKETETNDKKQEDTQETYIQFSKPPPSSAPSKQTHKKIHIMSHDTIVHHTRHRTWPIFLLVSSLFLFLIFFGLAYWHISILKKQMETMQYHLNTGDVSSVSADIKRSRDEVQRLKRMLAIPRSLPFIQFESITMADQLLTTADSLMETTDETVSLVSSFRLKDTGSFSGQQIRSQDLIKLSSRVDRSIELLKKASQESENVQLPFFPHETIARFLRVATAKLLTIQEALPLVLELFAKDTKQTYLVLLQNPMELRPTGGFIGSFALVTIDKSTLAPVEFFDVYDADGQLKGHIDPPAAIREYLHQPNWFLRDSNIDPDFAVSGSWALWFLQKEMNRNADGVIAVNLQLAQEMLRVTGPVTLKDFGNQVVSSNTILAQAHEAAHQDFFPGSTQKKDFLHAVSREVISTITSSSSLPWFDLLQSVHAALDQKNLMFYSIHKESQQFYEQHGWAGRINQSRCSAPDTTCAADYLSINEANLGVNKANYIVERSTKVQKTFTTDGKLISIISLHYTNINKTSSSYNEQYSNYLRIFIPRGSTITGAEIDGKSMTPDRIEQGQYGTDKQYVAVFITVPPQAEMTFTVSYTQPSIINTHTKTYEMMMQKQAGEKITPLEVSFSSASPFMIHPKNFSVQKKNEMTQIHQSDTSVDRIFALDVSS